MRVDLEIKSHSLLNTICSEDNLVRRTKSEMEEMTKRELILTIISQYANYDRLRQKYLEECLQSNYLKRRMKQEGIRFRGDEDEIRVEGEQ